MKCSCFGVGAVYGGGGGVYYRMGDWWEGMGVGVSQGAGRGEGEGGGPCVTTICSTMNRKS